MTGIPEGFELTEATIARVERANFAVDIPKTLEKFILNAEAKGWMYKNWQSAFINYVDNGEKFGGVYYKLGKQQDPAWKRVLAEAQKFGFREPLPHESPGIYETQFNQWKSAPKRTVNVTDLLKRA